MGEGGSNGRVRNAGSSSTFPKRGYFQGLPMPIKDFEADDLRAWTMRENSRLRQENECYAKSADSSPRREGRIDSEG